MYKKSACLFVLLCTACQPSPTQESSLTVGIQNGYPPFEFVNEEGAVVGFDIDLAERIAQKMGKKLVIKEMDFDGEVLALKQNKIDLIISGMNITPSRTKEIAMVPYHGNKITSLCLLFWGSIPDTIHSFDDIALIPNAVISVESGSNGEAFLSKRPQISTKCFQGSIAPLMDVKFGKSLAQIVEPDVAEFLMQYHPEIKILNVPLPKDEIIWGFGIGINKNNAALIKKVEQIVSELKESHELADLENTWFHKGASHDS